MIMASQPDIAQLSPGDRVQDPFLVMALETRGGEHPHTVLTLGNSTGSIQTSPFWPEDQPKIAGIGKRSIVQVIGEVATYRDKRQLKVTSIRVLPAGTIEPSRLLPSVGDVQRYWTYLDRLRSEIRGPRLRAVLDLDSPHPGGFSAAEAGILEALMARVFADAVHPSPGIG